MHLIDLKCLMVKTSIIKTAYLGNFFHFSISSFFTSREAFFRCLKAIKNRKLGVVLTLKSVGV